MSALVALKQDTWASTREGHGLGLVRLNRKVVQEQMTECLSRVDSMGWSQSRVRALVQVMGRWPELGPGAVDGVKGQHMRCSEGIRIDSSF